jgi:glycosyltransferase involved in cell wall biosynthesis
MSATQNGPALVDARWLGIGGPGRVAEHLLQGLHEIDPPGEWVVWGPDAVDAHLWSNATRVPNRHHPKALYSQREFPGPRSLKPRVAYFTHHLRPAWRLAPVELTTVHDTIPFRYPPSRALAPLMRAYIGWMARHSTLVTTDSEFSKQSLQEDLGLEPDRIVVLKLAIDHDSADRIKQLRTTAQPVDRVIFVGRDAPHKNLDRLVRGFAPTEFAAQGAVLTLAGVDGPAIDRLRTLASQLGANVELPGVVPQGELEQLLASATLLVQPSLEEGFGLPVAEAMAAGIPVAVSTGGSLPEIVRGTPVELFDPVDIDAICQAIDRVAASPIAPPSPAWPLPRDYAASVLAAIDQAEEMR